MLSLLLSVLSVYIVQHYERGFLGGIPLLILSLALYQAYIQVAICLFMFLILRMIFQNKPTRIVVITGMKYLLTLLVSLILYYAVWKLLLFATGEVATESYNGLTEVGGLFLQTYIFLGKVFLSPKNFHRGLISFLNVFVCGSIIMVVLREIKERQVRGWNLVIFIAVLALFPFGMNVVFFISKGVTHDLMIYSFFLVYLFALVVVCKYSKLAKVTKVAVGIVVWCNIVFANQAYFKKDLEFQGALAVMTRVLERIEQEQEYVVGVTPIVFVGDINSGPLAVERSAFSYLYDATGLGSYYSSTYDTYTYMREILGYPVVRGEVQDGFMEQDVVQEMGYFPVADSLQLVDGVMVVKFSDPIYYDWCR